MDKLGFDSLNGRTAIAADAATTADALVATVVRTGMLPTPAGGGGTVAPR